MSETKTDPRILNFEKDIPENWIPSDPAVRKGIRKIVLGVPPIGEERQPLRLSQNLPNFSQKFPGLTHLYLWQLEGPDMAGEWKPLSVPNTLEVLDVRNCPGLTAIDKLPAGLKTLVLDDCKDLRVVPPVGARLPNLADVSLKGCLKLQGDWVQALLAVAPALKEFDVSRCSQIEEFRDWPDTLERIELNDCSGVRRLPGSWPVGLRRLGMRAVAHVQDTIPGFERCPNLGDLDLQETLGLRALPEFASLPDVPTHSDGASVHSELRASREVAAIPRTLLLFGSGIDIDPALLGKAPGHNVAQSVLAHLDDIRRGTLLNNDVIVILLGDGGSGKSALLRRWLDDNYLGDREKSTHAIRLRNPAELPFKPIDPNAVEETAHLQIWDFAGQDLYHSTHRLFMRSDAVYLLCASPYGAGDNPKNDIKRRQQRDIVHGPAYWLGQIQAVGDSNRASRVILVRTKKDRDATELPDMTPTAFWEKEQIDLEHYRALEFSAAQPQLDGKDYVGALRDELSAAVAPVLGSKSRRAAGPGYSAVRTKLQHWKQLNDAERELAEKENRPARPPKPWMSFSEYQEIVRECIPEGAYREHPELLLSRFHQQGFLYYDERYLKDTVILDQRWAVSGMYAALHREFVMPGIREAGGVFTMEDLSGVWDEFDPETGTGPYSESEKHQILNFMQSAGMCFELRSGGEGRPAEYLLPEALPPFDEVAGEVLNRRGGALPNDTPVVLGGPSLGAPAVLDLMVTLGHGWREALKLWRWGGLFKSYRFGRADSNPTFVCMDWKPESDRSFGGKLTLSLYGPDKGFMAGILDTCRSLASFRGIAIPPYTFEDIDAPGKQEGRVAWAERGEFSQNLAAATLPASARAYVPLRSESRLVRIGISHAGDVAAKDSPARWQDLPSDSIERWPRALQEMLEAPPYGFSVVGYRNEQQKPLHLRSRTGRSALPQDLVREDLVVFFISKDFLRSNWCMWEFWMVFNALQGGHNLKETRIAFLPNAHYSSKPGGMAVRDEAVDCWKEEAGKIVHDVNQRVFDKMKTEPDLKQKSFDSVLAGIKLSVPFYSWSEFAFDAKERDRMADALFRTWEAQFVEQVPSDEQLKKWVDDIVATTEDALALLDYALHAYGRGDRDRALRLYDAFMSKKPDVAAEDSQNYIRRGQAIHLKDLHNSWLVEVAGRKPSPGNKGS